jgi:1,4-dihydroxy-2-naphthoate octaprenyltransferase
MSLGHDLHLTIHAMTQTTAHKSPLQCKVSSLQAWGTAVRPPSLLIAIAPVMVGTSLGYHQTGHINVLLVALASMAAVLMQVITNLQNDVGYTERGAEMIGHRIGLPRATALGWLTACQVKFVIVLLSTIATLLGLVLVLLRGWPVLALGSASLLAALAYMGGPKPIAYTRWGEATVFIFFGPVAVVGTSWLLTEGMGITSAIASIAVGSIAAAALAVNNHRDITHDSLAGRKTFAVSFGAKISRQGLAVLLTVPFIALAAMVLQTNALWPLLPAVMVPATRRLYQGFVRCPGGLAYNRILFRTFRMGLWFATLLSISAVMSK